MSQVLNFLFAQHTHSFEAAFFFKEKHPLVTLFCDRFNRNGTNIFLLKTREKDLEIQGVFFILDWSQEGFFDSRLGKEKKTYTILSDRKKKVLFPKKGIQKTDLKKRVFWRWVFLSALRINSAAQWPCRASETSGLTPPTRRENLNPWILSKVYIQKKMLLRKRRQNYPMILICLKSVIYVSSRLCPTDGVWRYKVHMYISCWV